MADVSEEATTLTARCHCGANDFKIDVSKNNIPLQATVCHCGMCRLILGTFCGTAARLTTTLFAAGVPETLSVYKPRTASYFFCSACFTHMFWYSPTEAAEPDEHDYTGHKESKGWYVYTSCLGDKSTNGRKLEELVKLTDHIFVADTGDGGMASWVAHKAEDNVKFWTGFTKVSKELTKDDIFTMERELKLDVGVETATHLDGGCHCGNVSVRITRKNGYERLVGCACGCYDCLTNATNEAGAQFIWADYPNIFFAKRDSSAGSEEWLSFPEDQLKTGNNLSGLNKSGVGVRVRESSKGVFRGACPTCGADVFYRYPGADEKRVSLAAGLFTHDAERLGSKHKGWLTWFGVDPSDVIDGRGEVLINDYLAGWKRWNEKFRPTRVISLGKDPKLTDEFFMLLGKARPGIYSAYPTHSLEEFESIAKEKENLNVVLLGAAQTDESEKKAREVCEGVWGKGYEEKVKFLRLPRSLLSEKREVEPMVDWYLEKVEKSS